MGGCRLTRTQTNSYLANSYLSQLVPNANPYPSQPVPSTNYSQTKSYPKKVKALILHILAANEVEINVYKDTVIVITVITRSHGSVTNN